MPQDTYKGKPIKYQMTSQGKTESHRAQIDVLQALRDHRCKSRLLHPAKLSITIDGERKTCHDKNKSKQFLSTNPALQKALERKL